MNSLWQDLRYALRGIRRTPGFAALIILTLALGIGANTAIFSVVNGVLLRPLPYKNSDRLVEVRSSAGNRRIRFGVSYPDYQDLQKLTGSFAGVGAYTSDRFNLTGGGEPRELQAALVSPELFGVMQVPPLAGRTFAPDEARAPVAVISYGLWNDLFGGDRSAVGRQIALDGHSFTIVGIMPASFAFPEPDDAVWLPLGWAYLENPDGQADRDFHNLVAVARLAPAVSLDKARGDLGLLAHRIAAAKTDAGAGGRRQVVVQMGGGPAAGGGGARQGLADGGFELSTLRADVIGDVRTNLLILLGAVALVLLIGCANAANLLIARAGMRRREIGIRAALGAGRGRLVRQLLTESVVLATAAAVAGLAVAAWGVRLLLVIWPRNLPRAQDVHLDLPVLGFALAAGVITGLLFGLLPALRLAAPEAKESLRDELVSGAGRDRRRAQSALVVVEVALALMLLIGAGLLVRSFAALNAVDLGFQPADLVAARIRLTPSRYATLPAQRQFFDAMTARLEQRPGVGEVSLVQTLPLSGARRMEAFDPREIRPDDREEFLAVGATAVSADFFSTMGIRLRQGRGFNADDREGTSPVVIVNQRLAHRLWPDQSPIGKTLPIGHVTVVGVVSDIRSGLVTEAPEPELYFPLGQAHDMGEMWVLLRAPHALRQVPALREAVASADRSQPVAEVVTFEQMISRQEAARRFNTTLITLFAALALVLAIVGIAGLTAYAVAQRTREIGIRMSLGAEAADVLRMLLGDSARLVGLGLLLGLAGATLATPVLGSMLYGISSRDVGAFASAGLVLGVAALAATWIPALRATRVDPVKVLRDE